MASIFYPTRSMMDSNLLNLKQYLACFCIMTIILGVASFIFLLPKPRERDSIGSIPVADTAVEQIKAIRIERPSASNFDPRCMPMDWTENYTPQTPPARLSTSASNFKPPDTLLIAMRTPTLVRHPTEHRTGRVSTPGYQTPFANTFKTHDFSILARNAPETYATLRGTGMLNKDGTPTKKMLANEKFPWDMAGAEGENQATDSLEHTYKE
ncbi:hypothetical protein K505DRAFT_417687 [Melanomma pulvis-pyrius CBS 109.77]|uniref:Uncharacterized protein n=1 Tax=Melanomma pulvis-pyrius CBS 109.77 TaxID=1314802 RepID=A0A6A6XAY9_9PLEO|nr:hypothetical protein K505DRAFT_417687 [Melanomma pulvis-pyrius CBS 109.77]